MFDHYTVRHGEEMHMENEILSLLKLREKDTPIASLNYLGSKFQSARYRIIILFFLGEDCCSVEFRHIHKIYQDMRRPVVFALEMIHILRTNAIQPP